MTHEDNAGTYSLPYGFTPYELSSLKPDIHPERMLKHFAFDHLPDHLANVSKLFARAALDLVELSVSGPERTVALRNLLLAKDAAVRSVLFPGG